MKRIFTLLAAVSMVITAMAQAAGITLAYNGGEKMLVYPADKLYQAIEDAKPNDILYFSAGTFSLNDLPDHENGNARQITKPLYLVGVGAFEGGTQFTCDKDLYLNIDGNSDNSKKEFSFEGIRFSDRNVRPISDIDNLLFRNYRGRYSSDNNDVAQFSIGKLQIDRCWMQDINLQGENVNTADINNSKITGTLSGYSGTIKEEGDKGNTIVNHCRIQILDSSFSGIVQYSLICNNYTDERTDMMASGYYYYSYNPGSSNKDERCFSFSNDIEYVDNNPAGSNADWGTLDTTTDPESPSPVGTTGGATPYSLYTSYPSPDPSKSSISYDDITEKMTVKVTLYGED